MASAEATNYLNSGDRFCHTGLLKYLLGKLLLSHCFCLLILSLHQLHPQLSRINRQLMELLLKL